MRRYRFLVGILAAIWISSLALALMAPGADANSDESSAIEDGPAMDETHVSRHERRERRLRERQKHPVPQNVRIVRNLTYVPGSTDPKQQLDLYLPPQAATSKLPLVVWIHGGGWRFGGARGIKGCEPLLGMGIAIASIDYRLTDKAIWPAQIYDCKAAIRWLRAHANAYNLDPNRIGVWGGSAGGHLAALVGTSGGVPELEGTLGNLRFSSNVQAVCDWYGPANLEDIIDQQRKIIGPAVDNGDPDIPETRLFVEWLLGGPVAQHKKEAHQASPITYVSNKCPPFLITHGKKDRTVPVAQSEELYTALKQHHVDAKLHLIEMGAHGHPGFGPDVRSESYEFFRKYLKPGSTVNAANLTKTH